MYILFKKKPVNDNVINVNTSFLQLNDSEKNRVIYACILFIHLILIFLFNLLLGFFLKKLFKIMNFNPGKSFFRQDIQNIFFMYTPIFNINWVDRLFFIFIHSHTGMQKMV